MQETVLMNVEKQKWNIELDKQPKVRAYRIFKGEFKLEDYIQMDLSLSQRSILAQLTTVDMKQKLKLRGYANFVIIILSNLKLAFYSNVHKTYLID